MQIQFKTEDSEMQACFMLFIIGTEIEYFDIGPFQMYFTMFWHFSERPIFSLNFAVSTVNKISEGLSFSNLLAY